MPVRVIVTSLAASSDPQALVHGHECDKTHHDGYAQQQVLVGLYHHEFDLVMFVLAEENLRQKMEKGVTQQAANSKCHHDGQGGRIDIGRT